MKLKAKIIAIALCATLAIGGVVGGSLAYFTDVDGEANIFTTGGVDIDLTEDFEQGATLVPGVGIDKKVEITNTGKSDAYVWYTIAVPSGLGLHMGSDEDADHKHSGAIDINFGDNFAADWELHPDVRQVLNQDDQIDYDVYTLIHKDILAPGESVKGMQGVQLHEHIDIRADGQWIHVENGIASPADDTDTNGPKWNTNNQGNPIIYVSAYAIQAEGLTEDSTKPAYMVAYETYKGQWNDGSDSDVHFAEVTNVVDNATLDEAIKAGKTNIVLGAGEYNMPASAKGKTLTISGQKDSVIKVVPAGQGEANGQLDYNLDGSTVNFIGVTIETNNNTYAGYARLKATYKGCTFNSVYTLPTDSVFTDCTFNVSGDQYNIWTWGAPTATFENCTFNCDGKAVLLYGQANTKLTLNNCTFNDKGDDTITGKAAIEIGNDYDKSYTLIVNNAKVNGFAENTAGIQTGTTLWANKNSMGSDKLNVVVDGVDIY